MTASDEAKKAMEGVTGGPWVAVFDRMTWGWLEIDGPSFHIGAPTRATDLLLSDEIQRKTDARFIAWARGDDAGTYGVPALLAEIAAKDAEIARLRGAMAPFDRMSGAMFARNWNKDGVAISFIEKDGPIRLTFEDFLAVRLALKGDTHE